MRFLKGHPIPKECNICQRECYAGYIGRCCSRIPCGNRLMRSNRSKFLRGQCGGHPAHLSANTIIRTFQSFCTSRLPDSDHSVADIAATSNILIHRRYKPAPSLGTRNYIITTIQPRGIQLLIISRSCSSYLRSTKVIS